MYKKDSTMRFTYSLVALLLVFCLIGLLFTPSASAFIEREYTIREVLNACTNIVFGKVKSVDRSRLRGGSSLSKKMPKVKVVLKRSKWISPPGITNAALRPKSWWSCSNRGCLSSCSIAIITVLIACASLITHGFRCVRIAGRYGGGSWWSFTHIDPMMSRTFDGKTKAFQKIVSDMLAGKMWAAAPKNAVKVLVLTGNSTYPTWRSNACEC